jgi:hypothetical protein
VPGLQSSLVEYLNSRGIKEHDIKEIRYKPNELLQELIEFQPGLVFVNPSMIKPEEVQSFIETIDLASALLTENKPAFIATFESENHASHFSYLISHNFYYFLIMSEEIQLCLRDCFYIGFDVMLDRNKFAMAKNIRKNIPLTIPVHLEAMNARGLFISGDISDSSSQVSITLQSEDAEIPLTVNKVKIKSKALTSSHSFTFYTEFLEKNSWLNKEDSGIGIDTIRTIAQSKDLFLPSNSCKIKIYNAQTNDHFIPPINNFQLDIIHKLEMNREIFDYEFYEIPVVFYQVDDEIFTYDHLGQMISSIHKFEQQKLPVFVLTNSPSKAEALKKLWNYQSILSTGDLFNQELFESLTSHLTSKRQSVSSSSPSTFFKHPINANTSIDVMLQALTERSMSFYSHLDIPLYSVLTLDIGLKFSLTIVPPLAM